MNINIKVININGSKKYTKKPFFENGELYIYCGRPRPLSNPFRIGVDSRGEVIEKFREELITKGTKLNQSFKDTIRYIKKNKKSISRIVLGCHCKPKACHCDVLKEKLDKRLETLYFNVFISQGDIVKTIRSKGVREDNDNIVIIIKNMGWIIVDENNKVQSAFLKDDIDGTNIKVTRAKDKLL